MEDRPAGWPILAFFWLGWGFCKVVARAALKLYIDDPDQSCGTEEDSLALHRLCKNESQYLPVEFAGPKSSPATGVPNERPTVAGLLGWL
jgi:hypothetical protein